MYLSNATVGNSNFVLRRTLAAGLRGRLYTFLLVTVQIYPLVGIADILMAFDALLFLCSTRLGPNSISCYLNFN